MKLLAALAVGYVVGATTGAKELDQLGRSLKALCETDEFADVVTAARAHVGAALRELAAVVDGGAAMTDGGAAMAEDDRPGAGSVGSSGSLPSEIGGDLVARVSRLVGRG